LLSGLDVLGAAPPSRVESCSGGISLVWEFDGLYSIFFVSIAGDVQNFFITEKHGPNQETTAQEEGDI